MNHDLISAFIVFVNVNARLFGFPRMRIKAVSPSLADLHIQSIARLIDKVVPVFDEQPQFVIGTSCVLAREIQMHLRPLRSATVLRTIAQIGNRPP
jgi:hypothetical protein